MVRITSRVGSVQTRLEISDTVMQGVVSLPHGMDHSDALSTLSVAGRLAGPNANALTDELRVEPLVGCSILNGVPVEVSAG